MQFWKKKLKSGKEKKEKSVYKMTEKDILILPQERFSPLCLFGYKKVSCSQRFDISNLVYRTLFYYYEYFMVIWFILLKKCLHLEVN